MRYFDHDTARETLRRAAGIPADAAPRWGTMNRDQMFGHLAETTLYTMGRRGPGVDRSTWFTRNLIKPVILSGAVKLPRNVKLPRRPGQPAPMMADGDIESLEAVIDEYLALAQAGELEPRLHPFFGLLGVDEWARFHVLHFDHHLRQFGV